MTQWAHPTYTSVVHISEFYTQLERSLLLPPPPQMEQMYLKHIFYPLL